MNTHQISEACSFVVAATVAINVTVVVVASDIFFLVEIASLEIALKLNSMSQLSEFEI